jgi:hypothetical protein
MIASALGGGRMADLLDDVAKAAGKTVLQAAADAAKAYLAEADRAQRNTAEACVAYLRAANAVLDGLLGEYDAILTEAATGDLGSADARRRLHARIHKYLREYELTRALEAAIKGIGACLAILKENPAGFLRLNPRRRFREGAVASLRDALGPLRTYLADIEAQGLRHRAAGTGIGAMQLNAMEKELAGEVDRDRILQLVAAATVDPERIRFEERRPNIQDVIVHLNAGFV